MVKFRSKRKYETRNLGDISINLLTLFPLYELRIFMMTTRKKRKRQVIKDYAKLKCVLRFYRTIEYFNKKDREGKHTQRVLLCLRHLLTILFLGHVFGALLFSLKNSTVNWTRNLHLHVFDRNSSVDWFVICSTCMSGVLLYNWVGE